MKLAVLASPDSWYVQDLQRAAVGRYRLQTVEHSLVSFGLGDVSPLADETSRALAEADAVLVRTVPPGSLEQVVFRMDALAQLEAQGKVVLNSPRAIEAAVDKFLATARCQRAGLMVPRTIVCQTAWQALAAFEQLGSDVVLKPIFGGEGRGLLHINEPELMGRAARTLERLGAVLYLQEFVPHEGCDLRLFVLGQQVWGMRRCNPLDWRTNVSRGAVTEPLPVDDQLRDIALAAARAVGAELAGVDVLPGRDGRLYLLEVNGVPGWKALAATLDLDVASLVLEYMAARVHQKVLQC